MFFILSKVLYFLIKPINWVAFLLLYSVLARKPKRKKRSLTLAVTLFFLLTNHFLFNQIARQWEVDSIRNTTSMPVYDIGILLGGYSNLNVTPNYDRHNFSDRANRLTQTLELYYNGKINKILLTGGSGRLIGHETSEAVKVAEYLARIGIPESDVIVEGASKNTYQNALYSTQIISSQYPDAKCLLITSAWHMRRAKGCFRKAGLTTTPFCVDQIGEFRRFAPESLFWPDRQGFYRWEVLVKEWVGYFFYWAKGYV